MVERDYWVTDLASILVYVALVLVAWAALAVWVGWSLRSVVAVGLVGLWSLGASQLADAAGAWVWRRGRR